LQPLINIVNGQKLLQVLGCPLVFAADGGLCRLCKYRLPFSGGEDALDHQLGHDNCQNLRMLLDFGEKEPEDEIYHSTLPRCVLAEQAGNPDV